jgi:DNA ligase-associated metallophosphoesterase
LKFFFSPRLFDTFEDMTHLVDFGGERLILHPWGAVYWERKDTLWISDVHLGKISHFRKYGAAVPRKALHRNFERLNGLLKYFEPSTICFLGDLFHSHLNREWELFRQWVLNCPATLQLVMGNHDIISPIQYEKLGITCVDFMETTPFLLTHHPQESFEGYNICGHIHPAVRLQGAGRQRLRLPCFFMNGRQMILPAFGSFTGSHVMEASPGDRIFALADNEIVALTTAEGKSS